MDGNTVQQTIGAQADANVNADEIDVSDPIYTFCLSANNDLVATTHKSGLIKLWQKSDGTLLKMWQSIHQGPVPKLTFSPNGKYIASGGSDASVRLWDYVAKMCVATFRQMQGVVSVVAFQPSNVANSGRQPLLIVAADDNKLHCWNTATKSLKFSLSGHFSKITSVSFAAENSAAMVSSGRDKVLILWDLNAGTQIRVVPVYECIESVIVLNQKTTTLPNDIRLSASKVYAASVGQLGTIKIWDMTGGTSIYGQTNSLIGTASEEGGAEATQLLLNQKNSQLAVVSADHNIMIHNLSTFYCAKQLIGFADEILDIAYFGKKSRYLAVATNSNAIKVYDTLNMNCKVLNGHTDIVLALASFKNYLLSASKDCTIRLWDIDTGKFTMRCIGIGTKHTSSVGSIAFGRTAHTIFASVSQDTCVKVWTLPKTFDSTGEKLLNLNCIATQIGHEKDINCVTISPNDKMVATGSQDKSAKLWDATTLAMVGVFRGHKRGIWCVRFSPIDQVLLTTSADCTMKLWSLADMTCLKTFEGHESSILKVEFISNGMQILSAGSDGLLKLWSIKTSECQATMDKHEGRIWAIALAHDETQFYSGGTDSQLIRWKDVTEERRAVEVAARQEVALQEQQLTNLIAEKKLLKALRLALRLEKPLLSLKIINSVIKADDGKELVQTIVKLSDSNKDSLLKHATTWNTNSRNCRPAQLVLNILMKEMLADKFRPPGLGKIVEETLPYTDRHFRRMTEYMKDLKFVEYTLKCMQPHVNFDMDVQSEL